MQHIKQILFKEIQDTACPEFIVVFINPVRNKL